MKRWKKLFLVLLTLVLLSQIPFAYRRYRLGRLHAAIQQLNSQRSVTADHPNLVDYKGVSHVHSFLGGHSTGNFEEIIAAAKANQLNFVLMTEHTSEHFNTAAMTLKGEYEGILFVNGNEVNAPNSDHLLLLPGLNESNSGGSPANVIDAESAPGFHLEDVLTRGRGKAGLTFVAYPQDFRGWDMSFYDGIEVYNLFTNARQINPLVMFFDGLWSYRSYPDLLFANFYRRPAENLQKWDQAIARTGRRLVAVAGSDAHSNVGISLKDDTGKTLAGLKLDPYERSFRLVRLHVLVPRDQGLSRESLLAALGAGHSYIGFDLFCDSAGFSFSASNGAENKIQGDEISLAKEVKLAVSTPVASRVVLLKDGNAIQDESGLTNKDYTVTEKGAYRVEVYLPQLPGPVRDQPWIISNPIYVR
jgi:hypothetical protein